MPIAMIFRESDEILKEDLPLPKKEMWYMRLTATPNKVFGEQVLVAAGMSDRWPARSEEVPVLLLNGEVKQLYQAAFTTFGEAMGVRPLESGEAYWYEQIKDNFMYHPAGVFSNPPTTTEDAHLPNPRPLQEESFGQEEDEEGVITLDTGATNKKGGSSRATTAATDKGTLRFRQSNLEDYVVASDSLESLSHIGEKKKISAAGSKSSGSAGKPLRRLRVLSIIKPPKTIENEVEKVVKKPAGNVILEKEKRKETETTAATKHATAQHPEFTRITGLDQPPKEKVKEAAQPKGPEVVMPSEPAQPDAPTQTMQVTSAARGSAATVPKQAAHKDASTATGGAGAGGSSSAAGAFTAGQEDAGSQGSMSQAPIGSKDTLGDIYYKTYTVEARGDAPHQPIWGLKQKDRFVEFGACREWYLGSFPPGEVNRQRAHTQEGLFRAYIVGEANTRVANHQIMREWRTMVKERADGEKYRECLLKQVQNFEQMKNSFAEENAAFEAEKKSKEWGREDLKSKLQAAEELLSKERA
ncbi:hypothetical protein Hanom_Chr16g01422641 [Helianthus anomalus]